jgi:serine/threonine-protein kinase HipA
MAEVATLNVLLQGRLIGTITRLPDDRSFFVFDNAYIEDQERPTLSLSFKDALGALITDSRPHQTRLPPFFSNLLPEGALREYLAVRASVKPEREFFLAWVLGHDLPGAVQILPSDPNSMPPENGGDWASAHAQGSSPDHVLRFSLAGVQLKFSAVQRATGGLTIPADGIGGSWIVKLPSPKFAGMPENEFAMMELARRIGIEVPETNLVSVSKIQGLPAGIELVGDTAFAIKRFDRQSPQGRIHIEDFAQVFGVYPERKYERANYRNIARVLWIETGEPGIVELVRRLVFNTLIGNADMHLKNWSLIYPDGRRARLAPAYDYVSTILYLADEKMALNFLDSRLFTSMTRDSFTAFAAKAGLPQKMTLDTVEQTVRAFAETLRRDDVPGLTGVGRDKIDSHLRLLPLWHEYTH